LKATERTYWNSSIREPVNEAERAKPSLNPPKLPAPLQAIWTEITAPRCQRCLVDPILGPQLAGVARAYLPYPTIGVLPPGATSVTHVLVGSEPAVAFDSIEEAALRIARGERNFAGGTDESCLQYAMEHWLLAPGDGYYFTDFAKCTMPTDLAKETPARYRVCSEYFIRELAALRPRMIIAAGLAAYRALKEHKRPEWPIIFSVVHYSPRAGNWHREVAKLAGPEHLSRVPDLADFSGFIEGRRRAFGHTRPSRHKPNRQHTTLLTAYSVQFATIRAMLEAGSFNTNKPSMVHVRP
jgi:hypothetical protein